MAKHKTPLALVAPSTLAAINADIEALNMAVRKLRDADSELLREDLALQRTNVPTRDDALHHAALQLLDGTSADAPKSRSTRIREITSERAKIAKALEIAEGRMTRLHFDRAIEQRKLIADDWAALQRERALAVVQLQSLNRRAQAMLATVADPHGRTEMPGSFPGRPAATFLLGNASLRAGEAYEFIELCIKNGTITRDEIAKES